MYYIYKHLNKDNEVIYVGLTTNMKTRQSNHLSTSDWKNEIDRIEYCDAKNEKTMKNLEIYFINKLMPKYNKKDKTGDDVSWMDGAVKEFKFYQYWIKLYFDNKVNDYDKIKTDIDKIKKDRDVLKVENLKHIKKEIKRSIQKKRIKIEINTKPFTIIKNEDVSLSVDGIDIILNLKYNTEYNNITTSEIYFDGDNNPVCSKIDYKCNVNSLFTEVERRNILNNNIADEFDLFEKKIEMQDYEFDLKPNMLSFSQIYRDYVCKSVKKSTFIQRLRLRLWVEDLDTYQHRNRKIKVISVENLMKYKNDYLLKESIDFDKLKKYQDLL